MATLWIAGILPARGRSERRERQAEALRGGRPLRAAGIVGAAAVEGMARTAALRSMSCVRMRTRWANRSSPLFRVPDGCLRGQRLSLPILFFPCLCFCGADS